MYGHGESNCTIVVRCANCAGQHKTSECKSAEVIKCANCGGNHKSYDVSCPSRAAFAAATKRRNILAPKASIQPVESHNRHKVNASVANGSRVNAAFYSPAVVPGLSYSRVVSSAVTPVVNHTTGLAGGKADLFSEAELLQLATEMLTSLRGCTSKDEQFAAIVRLTSKYLYNNVG